MPARPVKDQDDLLGGTRSRLTRKGSQFGLEQRDTDAGRQMEVGAARRGMDKADEVAPGVAVLHGRNGPLANRRPDASQERFQANTMLIRRPQFDHGMREGDGHLP
jgi:hypothetical protein